MPGFTNVDRKFGQEAFPLPYPDESVEAVRASRILEHFGHREVQAVLNDWVRVLQDGGAGWDDFLQRRSVALRAHAPADAAWLHASERAVRADVQSDFP